ncbi:MAG: preprotein translocase subunit SecG [Nitrospinae bacterium]|nr:preprotein translocase subunit SecG [Nitrospinota bacterium]
MTTVLTILHVLVGLALILIVLLQRGKGASMGAAFGGSSQTLFGSRGPQSFLGKLTTIVAIVFMVTSLSLAILSSKKPTASLIKKTDTHETKPNQSKSVSASESESKKQ